MNHSYCFNFTSPHDEKLEVKCSEDRLAPSLSPTILLCFGDEFDFKHCCAVVANGNYSNRAQKWQTVAETLPNIFSRRCLRNSSRTIYLSEPRSTAVLAIGVQSSHPRKITPCRCGPERLSNEMEDDRSRNVRQVRPAVKHEDPRKSEKGEQAF